MTSDQIKDLANTDRVGDSLDLDLILRTEVLMDVWTDIGEARWKRVTTTLTLTENTRQSNLPDDFDRMEQVHIPASGIETLGSSTLLGYIGENENLILKAEFNTDPSRPGSFWIVQRAAEPNEWKAIRFSCLADQDYTVYYTYQRFPHFEDYQGSVEFDTYMPRAWQSGLVKRLRMWILMDRFGQQDPRYDRKAAEYSDWLANMLSNGKDQARRDRQVYV